MNLSWYEDAEDWALEKFETILQTHKTKDFVEFVGTIGGDVLTYRYYASGVIGEK